MAVRLTRDEAGYRVEVRDSGIGIPPQDLPHLFTRFFRAGNAIAQAIPGTGVGLFIVKSIVEKRGGRVQARSQREQGTVMEVGLPARAAEPPAWKRNIVTGPAQPAGLS